MTGPLPTSSVKNTELRRRQVYLLVAALTGLSQAILATVDLRARHAVPWGALAGVLLCAAAVALLSNRRVSMRQVDHVMLLGASLAVAGQLAAAFWQPAVPPPRLYLIGILLFIASFSVLRARYAFVHSALLLLAFTALTLVKGGDVTLLIELAVVVMLIAHMSVFGQRVSAERAEARVFHQMASTDPLTGLANRRATYGRLEQAFADAEAGTTSAAVLLLDIDHFKSVNDQHGHPVGDQVLQGLAEVLRQSVRETDFVCRWGGEEFLILLTGVDAPGAARVAQQVLARVRQSEMQSLVRVTASCGVALASEVASVAGWLLLADTRLYQAKRAGRDRVCISDQAWTEPA